MHLHYASTRPPQQQKYLLYHKDQYFSFQHQPHDTSQDDIPSSILWMATMTYHSSCTRRHFWHALCAVPIYHFLSVQFSCSVVSDSLWPHGLQHARPPCPSPTPEVYSNSCPSSQWCHPNISSSAVPFSSHLQSFPASGSFPMSQLFTSGGQSIGASASASVLPMNIQDWLPVGFPLKTAVGAEQMAGQPGGDTSCI